MIWNFGTPFCILILSGCSEQEMRIYEHEDEELT